MSSQREGRGEANRSSPGLGYSTVAPYRKGTGFAGTYGALAAGPPPVLFPRPVAARFPSPRPHEGRGRKRGGPRQCAIRDIVRYWQTRR